MPCGPRGFGLYSSHGCMEGNESLQRRDNIEPRVLLLTNEYPPHIYGGAGVHVEYLSRALAQLTAVDVRTFGTEDLQQGRLRVQGFHSDPALFAAGPPAFASPLTALQTCLAFVGQGIDTDVVHCYTWYTHFGGMLTKLLYHVPLVVTVHSL